jgi:hypothetical protein
MRLNMIEGWTFSRHAVKKTIGKLSKKEGLSLDPLTLIVLVVIIVLFFPLFMRGIGCLLKTIVTVVLIAAAFIFITQLI